MTEKRWLIRTRSKQILGPASKEKIISLLEKQSLNDEDELSSGNGYWFWIKEKKLVEKYLYNGEAQGFNPVSESKSVLVSEEVIPVEVSREAVKLEESDNNDIVMPAEEDLAFPDTQLSDNDEEMMLDHTSVITLDQLSSKSLHLENSHQNPDEQEDFEADKLEKTEDIKPPIKKVSKKVINKKSKFNEITKEALEEGTVQEIKKTRNDRYLFLLLLCVCLILFGVFYYYRTIINKPIPIIGISNAHAQSMSSLVKKKVQLT